MATLRLVSSLVTLALGLGACFAPPTQSQRVTDAARELNVAARFGRMDLAAGHASRAARKHFLERRAQWGNRIRVVDVALASLAMGEGNETAHVHVDIAWVRIDEGSLRSTRVAQLWRERDGVWQLTREKRAAGDIGLFGEAVKISRSVSPDVHFASKTIR